MNVARNLRIKEMLLGAMTRSRSAIQGSRNWCGLRFSGLFVARFHETRKRAVVSEDRRICRISRTGHATTFTTTSKRLPRLKGDRYSAWFSAYVLAYRGKLVVTAAQSRSVETVQQDTEKEEEEEDAEGGRQGGREKLRDADKNVAGSQQDIP